MLARSPRRGGLTLEMLLLMPVLLSVVLASVEFSLIIAAERKLANAAALGGRVASQGGNLEAVEKAVSASLGGGNWTKAKIKAILDDENQQPLPSGSNVEVTVSIGTTEVVPDLLAFVGVSFKNQTLGGRSLLRKE